MLISWEQEKRSVATDYKVHGNLGWENKTKRWILSDPIEIQTGICDTSMQSIWGCPRNVLLEKLEFRRSSEVGFTGVRKKEKCRNRS